MKHSAAHVVVDERKLDALFAALNQAHLPGIAVGVAVAGRPVYRKGFGLANMEMPLTLSPAMRMRIGSVTKQFACLAYLLLCEDGKAQLDDSITRHLPEVHRVAQTVTVRQLMGNIGGLRDPLDLSFQFSGRGLAISSNELLALYRDIGDANAAPGSTWIYNNGGFLMLSAAIERLSGQSLETFLRERVFLPVGMNDTLLRRVDTDFVANSATLHTQNAAGGFEKAYIGSEFAGEGGMVSTVDDMLRWLAHMDAPTVGNETSWRAMRTPQRLLNGTSTGYGFGLALGRYRGHDIVYHPGHVMGGNALMLKAPQARLDVVIMSNRGDVRSAPLGLQVLELCLGLGPDEPTHSWPLARGLFYCERTSRVIQLHAVDGKQQVCIDGSDREFERAPDGAFVPHPTWDFIKQSVTLRGDPAQPDAVRFNEFGNQEELTRITRQPRAEGICGRYAGGSITGAAGVHATISDTGAGLRLATTGKFGSTSYRLEALAHGVWRARPTRPPDWWGGVLVFSSDGDYTFSSQYTRALPFRRQR